MSNVHSYIFNTNNACRSNGYFLFSSVFDIMRFFSVFARLEKETQSFYPFDDSRRHVVITSSGT